MVVDPATELAFLHDLPVELMWGVGPVTEAKLARERRRRRSAQLAKTPAVVAGAAARARAPATSWRRSPGTAIRARIVDQAAGALGRGAVGDRQEAGNGERVPPDAAAISPTGSPRRLSAKIAAGRTVTVRVRFADMRAVTRSITL